MDPYNSVVKVGVGGMDKKGPMWSKGTYVIRFFKKSFMNKIKEFFQKFENKYGKGKENIKKLEAHSRRSNIWVIDIVQEGNQNTKEELMKLSIQDKFPECPGLKGHWRLNAMHKNITKAH